MPFTPISAALNDSGQMMFLTLALNILKQYNKKFGYQYMIFEE